MVVKKIQINHATQHFPLWAYKQERWGQNLVEMPACGMFTVALVMMSKLQRKHWWIKRICEENRTLNKNYGMILSRCGITKNSKIPMKKLKQQRSCLTRDRDMFHIWNVFSPARVFKNGFPEWQNWEFVEILREEGPMGGLPGTGLWPWRR